MGQNMGIMSTPNPAEAEAARRERAARKEREQQRRQDMQDRAEMIRDGRERPPEEFLGLGVFVRDGKVKVQVWSRKVIQVLGPLAGAQAGIAGSIKTGGAGGAVAATALFGTLGAVGSLSRRGTKPFAYVVFPDGTLHQEQLTDKRVAARAQADVLRFNVSAGSASAESPGHAST
jgi:hypothetical protein